MTYRTSYLNLIVHVAPVGMIVGLVLVVRLELLAIHTPCLDIRVIIVWLWGLGNVVRHRGHLAEPVTGVPHLEDDIEDFPVDLPGRATEHVQPGIHQFDVSEGGRVFQIGRLLGTVLEPHHMSYRGWMSDLTPLE